MRPRLGLLVTATLVLPLTLAGAPGLVSQAWAAPESGVAADSAPSEDRAAEASGATGSGTETARIEVTAPLRAQLILPEDEDDPPEEPSEEPTGEPSEEPTGEPTGDSTEDPSAGPAEPAESSGNPGEDPSGESTDRLSGRAAGQAGQAERSESPAASAEPSAESGASADPSLTEPVEDPGSTEDSSSAVGPGSAQHPGAAEDSQPTDDLEPSAESATERSDGSDGSERSDDPEDSDPGPDHVLQGSTDPEPADASMALPGNQAYSAQLRVDASGFVNDLGPLDMTLDSAHGPEGGVVAAGTGDRDQAVGANLDSRHAATSSTQVRPGGDAALDWAFTEPGTYCLELGFSAAMPARTADGTRIRRDSVELRVHVGPGAPQTECGEELVRAAPPEEADADLVIVEEGRARISPGEEGVTAELAETSADLVDGSGARHEASQVIWSAHRRSEANGRWYVPEDQVDAGLDLSGLGDPGRATAVMRMHSGPGTAQYRSATDPRAPHDLLVPPQGRENDRVVALDRATPGRESATAWNFETAGRYCIDLTVHSRHGEETRTSTTRLTFASGEDADQVEPCAEPGEDIPDVPLPEGHDKGDDGDGSGPGGDDDPAGGGADGGADGGANGKTPDEDAGGMSPGSGDTGMPPSDEDSQDEEDALAMPPAASVCRPVEEDQDVQIRSGTAVLKADADHAAWQDNRAQEPVSRDPERVTLVVSEEAEQTVRGDALGEFAPEDTVLYRTKAAPQDGVPWLGWSFEDVPDYAQVTWSLDSVEGPGEFAILDSNALGEQSVMLSAQEPAEFSGGEAGFGSWAFTEPGYYMIWSRFTIDVPGSAQTAEAVVPLRFAVGENGSATSGNPLLQSFLGECEDSMFSGAFPQLTPEDDDSGPFSFFGSSVPLWQWVAAGAGLAASLVLGAAVAWIARGGRRRGGADASGALLLSGATARSGGVSGLSGAAGEAGAAGQSGSAGDAGGAGQSSASGRGSGTGGGAVTDEGTHS